jgi:hypothetical protein
MEVRARIANFIPRSIFYKKEIFMSVYLSPIDNVESTNET